MAHNRLYILDTKTGERLFVAKSFGDGWDWRANTDDINAWLTDRDHDASYHDAWGETSDLVFVTENQKDEQ